MLTQLGFCKYAFGTDVQAYLYEKARLREMQNIRTVPDLQMYMSKYKSGLDIPEAPDKRFFSRQIMQNKASRGPMSTFYSGITGGVEPSKNIRVKDLMQLYEQDSRIPVPGPPSLFPKGRMVDKIKAPASKEFWANGVKRFLKAVPRNRHDVGSLVGKLGYIYNQIPDIPEQVFFDLLR